jgi:hypothetical protein
METKVEGYAQFVQLLYEAVDEINQGQAPGQALEKSPATVLMGSSGKLDSLGFVTLVVALEEKMERALGRHVSVIDSMFGGDEKTQWTIADLAARLAQQ